MTAKPTAAAALPLPDRSGVQALKQQARDLAHSVETTRQRTLAESNTRIELLEKKARDLALFVETTRKQVLSQSDQKIEALEQKARDLADFVETLRHQTRLQSEKKIEALGKKARDLAHSVEVVRKETRRQFETEIAAMEKKAGDLAASVEAVGAMTLRQWNSEIALLGQSKEETVAMNEALLLGSLRMHELAAAEEKLNAQLTMEVTARRQSEEAVREAHAQLAAHAGQLESRVATRTAQLTATNRQLETAIRFTRKAKEEFRTLFGEAQVMGKKLRLVTHQVLTAQEEERKKISRDLHDVVVQTLVGINIELSALVHGNSPGLRHVKDKIAHTQRLVESSVDAVHRFARELRPTVLDDLGLIPALHAFCLNLAERKKLKIKLTTFGGVEAMATDHRTVLFRVAQEALGNVARHAHATRAALTITKIAGAIRMEISDNGQSFPVAKILGAKNPKRLGLVGMRERIEMIGGTFAIDSKPGTGTTVRAEIPFSPEKTSK